MKFVPLLRIEQEGWWAGGIVAPGRHRRAPGRDETPGMFLDVEVPGGFVRPADWLYFTLAGDLVDAAVLFGPPPDPRLEAMAMIRRTIPTARRPMTPAMTPLATLDVPAPRALNW